MAAAALTGIGTAPAAAGSSPPVNDSFSAPIVLDGDEGTIAATTSGATLEVDEPRPSVGSGEDTIWFTFTASRSAGLSIDTCGSPGDVVLDVYTGSDLSSLVHVFANDDQCGLSPFATFTVTESTTYRVQVSHHDDVRGPVVVNWALAEGPPALVRTLGDGDDLVIGGPRGIAVDAEGGLWIADPLGITRELVRTTALGEVVWRSSTLEVEPFTDRPNDVAVRSDGSALVIAGDRVWVVGDDGSAIDDFGGAGTDEGQFNDPFGIAVGPFGTIYVADSGNDRISVLNADGTPAQSSWTTGGFENTPLDRPSGIAVGPDGYVYVTDSSHDRVLVYEPNGIPVTEWSTIVPGRTPGAVGAIAVGPDGLVYVADSAQGTVTVYSSGGARLSEWNGAGPGQAAGRVNGLDVDAYGNLYVSDLDEKVVRVFGDAVAPSAAIVRPVANSSVMRGSTVRAAYTCADDVGGSGVASCAGPVASGAPIDTTSPGPRTFTVVATDNTSNTSQMSSSYTVVNGRPDARVRVGTRGRLVGNDVRAPSPVGQTVTSRARAGATATFVVSLQNDASASDRLVVRGARSAPGVQVVYRAPDGSNVTRAVVAGTYRTPLLAPGATLALRVQVTVTSRVPVGARRAHLVTTSSISRSGSADQVSVVTVRRP